MDLILKVALRYAELGFKVVPNAQSVNGVCSCYRGKECKTPGKHPTIKEWSKNATKDKQVINSWHKKGLLKNIGLLTGKDGGFIVIDVDDNGESKFGKDRLSEIENELGKLPDTVEQITGSGGQHLLFKPCEKDIKNLQHDFDFWKDIDIRGEGGQIIVYPSIHPNGNMYEWEVSNTLGEYELAELPKSWIDKITNINKITNKSSKVPEIIRNGNRDNTFFSIACSLWAKGFDEDEIYATLTETNKRCETPLSDSEILNKVKSASKYPKSNHNLAIKPKVIEFNKQFTKEEFLKTDSPYSYAYKFNNDQFSLERVLNMLSEQASTFKIRNFKSMYKSYVAQQNKENNTKTGSYTKFTKQKHELSIRQWTADDTGVSFYDNFGIEQFACVHPITIHERLTNVDTGLEKLRIAFSRSFKWKEIIVEKKVVASANKIIDLADLGIAVTSETSKLLVRYLHDLEHENYSDIPEKRCCSRFGWIEDEGFAPYCDELNFDGDTNLTDMFNSIKSVGNFDLWKKEIIKNCEYNPINKLSIAASFAAPLLQELKINNFWLHLWADSGIGKTVSLMLSASVWGNPSIGKYIKTFNSTNVGKERIAEMCNNIPVFFDEIQIVTDKTSFDREIYELCEGAGRLRGNKTGTTDKTGTWNTCFMTTGEKPIIGENSQGGAMNRTIEIECEDKITENGNETCQIITKNFGYAGKEFINNIAMDEVKSMYKSNYEKLEKHNKTEKQTSIGAVLLTSFSLASKIVFDSKMNLSLDEIAKYLSDKNQISTHEKSYNYMIEWISRNINKFKGKDNNDVFGKLEDSRILIIKSVFDKMCSENDISPSAFISWLKRNNKIETGDKNTIPKRINGILSRCIVVKEITDIDLPFD